MTSVAKYIGREDAFAEQQPDGSYLPVRTAPAVDDILEHKQGTRTLGTYTNSFDKARFIVFDDDTGNLALAQQLKNGCQDLGLSAGVEFSGRKGYHVWVLFQQWEPASDVRRLARHIAEQVGFLGEVFPKQEVARDLGNLVKLPFGVHRVTGQRSRFVGPEPVPVGHDVFIAAVGTLPPPRVVPRRDLGSARFPCLESIQTRPPQEGERNNLWFHFAGHMRRAGLTEETIIALMHTLGVDDELPEYEFESIIRNSDRSGPVCNQLPADRRCPEELCVKTQGSFKGTLRPGALKHATAGTKVLVEKGEAEPGKTTVPLLHPDIISAAAALKGERSDGADTDSDV